MDRLKVYNVANGSATIIIRTVEKEESKIALEVLTNSDFNGTADEISLVQSNDIELPLDKWHPLPEDALVLESDESHLLTSCSFTAKFIALKYVSNNGDLGTLTLTENFKK